MHWIVNVKALLAGKLARLKPGAVSKALAMAGGVSAGQTAGKVAVQLAAVQARPADGRSSSRAPLASNGPPLVAVMV